MNRPVSLILVDLLANLNGGFQSNRADLQTMHALWSRSVNCPMSFGCLRELQVF
jgi:hypothetical protein